MAKQLVVKNPNGYTFCPMHGKPALLAPGTVLPLAVPNTIRLAGTKRGDFEPVETKAKPGEIMPPDEHAAPVAPAPALSEAEEVAEHHGA